MHKHLTVLFCAAGVALSAPAFAKSKLKVKPNAPARYVVKQGDTLWEISGKYLYRPWKWPALWQVNRGKIRNPHLIYPGQELYLSYVNGRPVLTAKKRARSGRAGASQGGIPTIKLGPRTIDLDNSIPTINVDFYRLFMKHPQFVAEEDLAHAPRIVAGEDGRTLFTTEDRIYADGPIESGSYLVYRVKEDLKDPISGKSLGRLVEFAGEASTLPVHDHGMANRDNQEMTPKQREKLRADEYYVREGHKRVAVRTAQAMKLTNATSEILRGDYLLKKPDVLTGFYMMPHPPARDVDARIVTMMDGISESAMTQTIILNKGEADGIDAGTVLAVYKPNRIVKTEWNNPDKKASQFVNLPTEEIGLAMVYRTGKNVSSAIILESSTNVSKGDVLRAPGGDLSVDEEESTVLQGGMIEGTPGFLDDVERDWKDVIEHVK